MVDIGWVIMLGDDVRAVLFSALLFTNTCHVCFALLALRLPDYVRSHLR